MDGEEKIDFCVKRHRIDRVMTKIEIILYGRHVLTGPDAAERGALEGEGVVVCEQETGKPPIVEYHPEDALESRSAPRWNGSNVTFRVR